MRIRYAALAGAFAAVVAAYVGYWFWAARALERGVLRWAEERRAEGVAAEWRALSVEGFPFRLRLSFEEPRLASPDEPTEPEWRGARLVALAHPWNLRHVLASFEGEQTFAFTEAGQRRRIAVRTESWLASWQANSNGRTTRLSLDLRGLEATEGAAAPLRAARLQIHARPGQRPEALADLALKADDLELPEAAGSPLGAQVERAELDATVMGPLIAGGYPQAVLRWRDEGGVVEVRRAAMDWDGVQFEATGTLALDAETRPEGAFTARVRNHRRLLDALADAGTLTAEDARLARAALDLLAAAGGGVLSAPLTLQNGQVWLGPAAVGRLSPLLPDAGRNQAPASPAPRR